MEVAAKADFNILGNPVEDNLVENPKELPNKEGKDIISKPITNLV